MSPFSGILSTLCVLGVFVVISGADHEEAVDVLRKILISVTNIEQRLASKSSKYSKGGRLPYNDPYNLALLSPNLQSPITTVSNAPRNVNTGFGNQESSNVIKARIGSLTSDEIEDDESVSREYVPSDYTKLRHGIDVFNSNINTNQNFARRLQPGFQEVQVHNSNKRRGRRPYHSNANNNQNVVIHDDPEFGEDD
ncbi:uncharacterized protein LOC105695470 isoform X2 [Orussus abietinus]|uniref:uncharacterized protein LOC105695470 isoform X2 n=1 Tax=Orussus abietinus TaxID=222816 RepID=UPI000626BFC1|nr:uncharacterized protein LOC105695470 isoform X2 [Orussus abietinus]